MSFGLTVVAALAAANVATAPIPAATWASAHEAAGHWETALGLYLRLHETDRTALPDLPERIHRCVRWTAQFRRHRDPAFQQYVHSLTLADSLTVYSDIVEKLGRLFADPDRATPVKLFQRGKDELTKSLADAEFVTRHLRGADETRVRTVRTWLANFQIHPTANLREIRVAVRDVAVGLREAIPGTDPAAVVLEFLFGACGGLDEHTTFHPPGTLPKPMPGPTVVGATMADERFGVGYLRVTEFRETTASEFDAVVGQLRMRGLRSLVVDLRGNPGGLLTAGIDVARKLLPNGVIVRTDGQAPDFADRVFVSESGMTALTLPLVLLVDTGTMSAAEVVAGAIKDNRRGTLVGTQTFGKGTVQVPVKTSETEKGKPAGILVVTVARTTGPDGLPVSRGIVPDLIERDPELQLKAAIAEAAALTMTGRP